MERALLGFFAALPVAMVFALAGCNTDECTAGGAGCEGNIAGNCVSMSEDEVSSYTVWTRVDCGDGVCLPPQDGVAEAFCALDASPDPECPEELRALREASRCVDGAVVTWRYGYRSRVSYCVDGKVCVDISTEDFDPTCGARAFCSGLSTPDPRCEAGIGSACADDSTLFYCECGFRRLAHACSDPGPSCTYVNLGGGLPPQGVCR